MTLTSYDTLDNEDIKDIRHNAHRHHATAIGTRSYYYKDTDGTTLFVSYWTDIARLNNNVIKFVCTDIDLYTRTTVKHLNAFLRANGFNDPIGIADIRKESATGWKPINLTR
jgi:hypothetical protein